MSNSRTSVKEKLVDCVRVSGFEPGGRRFESVRVRQINQALRPLLIRYTHLRIVYGFNKQLLTTSTINIAVKQTT